VFWLHRANKGAHEFFIDLWSNCVDIYSGCGKEFASVFDAIDAGRLDFYLFESGGGEFGAIFGFVEGTGHAANPSENALADLGRHFASGHYVGDGEASTWFEHAEGFTKNAGFI
jgi:hypothetical protein